MTTHPPSSISRLAQALIVSASLLLLVLLMAVAVLVVAVQRRVLELPHFAMHVGQYYLTAPCPARTLVCDVNLNYYAIWSGHDLPDGSVHFDEVYFTYLNNKH